MSGDPSIPRTGFFGKIPSRGDFVRAGLPRGFVDAWDAWLQSGIFESRARLGEGWVDAWMEAPIWRFHLQPGLCGPDAALGLFMPSVDRAGRYFPLTLAHIGTLPPDPHGWLDLAQAAGFAALDDDIEPAALAALLEGAPPAGVAPPLPQGLGVWWTDGAPRVPATAFAQATMPEPVRFTSMLDCAPDRFNITPPAAPQE